MEYEKTGNEFEKWQVEVTQFVMPDQLNHMGIMHGGEILKLMDNTAGIAFIRYAGGKAVTVGADNIKFLKPVPAHSIIKCKAEIIHIGRTSVRTQVSVFVEELDGMTLEKAAEGTFTGVAIDEEGRPRVLPKRD